MGQTAQRREDPTAAADPGGGDRVAVLLITGSPGAAPPGEDILFPGIGWHYPFHTLHVNPAAALQ